MAISGRIDLLAMIFGSGKDAGGNPALPRQRKPMTADGFRAMAKSHNAHFKGRRDGSIR